MDVLSPQIPRTQAPVPARVPARERIAGLWRLLRPQQWVKSLFVVPIGVLGVTEWSLGTAAGVGWALALFVVASSAVYVVNDILDREADRAHPVKRSRPIASGRVSIRAAALLAAGLLLVAAALLAARTVQDAWPAGTYLVINAAYTLGLKRVAVVDIAVVASGFALRYVQGAIAAEGEVSVLLALTIFAACLMFAAGKRRHEIGVAGSAHRPALAGYSIPFLDQLIGLAVVTTLLAYALHVQAAFSPGVPGTLLLVSVPLVVAILVRYLQLILVRQQGGDPSKDIAADRVTIFLGGLTGVLLVLGTVLP
ncbi:UbiA family prenyltransferase [Myceligenerans crystallogenes]|uniref:Decaprenyl-phosphate phosphoribosyltransferase n=1 Tax=Myceligenerans crystallogenes TaxID=316335 RepID=A0ABP4ZKN0_9MICO